MIKKLNIKKIFAVMAVAIMSLMTLPVGEFVNAAMPALSISALSSTVVKEGGSVSFTLKYTGDIRTISLKLEDIGLEGFTATKNITESGNNRVVTLTNIKGIGESTKGYVHIAGGTAISSDFQMVNEINSAVFTIVPKDTVAPVLVISNPNPEKVYVGGTVTYTLTYTDNVAIKKISLKESDLGLEGFTADKKIVINSDNTATVTLSNIQGTVGGGKTLYVAGGTAIDNDYNMANEVKAPAFIIEEKVEEKPQPTPTPDTEPTPEVNPTPDTEVQEQPQDKPADWIPNPNTGRI